MREAVCLVEGVGHSGVGLERLTKKCRKCVFGVVSGGNGPEFVWHPLSTGRFYKPTDVDQSRYLAPDRGSNRTPFFFDWLAFLTSPLAGGEWSAVESS